MSVQFSYKFLFVWLAAFNRRERKWLAADAGDPAHAGRRPIFRAAAPRTEKRRHAMGYTASAKAHALEEKWFYVDAEGKILGRLASDIAYVLRGKHMTNYTPHANMRTHVIVLNADKVKLTGDKLVDKKYYRHSGWVGGLRETNAGDLLAKKPCEVLRIAIKGMLPKNRLSRVTMTRVRLYSGAEHDHQAQKPDPLPARTVGRVVVY